MRWLTRPVRSWARARSALRCSPSGRRERRLAGRSSSGSAHDLPAVVARYGDHTESSADFRDPRARRGRARRRAASAPERSPRSSLRPALGRSWGARWARRCCCRRRARSRSSPRSGWAWRSRSSCRLHSVAARAAAAAGAVDGPAAAFPCRANGGDRVRALWLLYRQAGTPMFEIGSGRAGLLPAARCGPVLQRRRRADWLCRDRRWRSLALAAWRRAAPVTRRHRACRRSGRPDRGARRRCERSAWAIRCSSISPPTGA